MTIAILTNKIITKQTIQSIHMNHRPKSVAKKPQYLQDYVKEVQPRQ